MAILVQRDGALVGRSRLGDQGAFAVLVERYQRLVVGVAFSITCDHALAEDLAQETFVSAWKGLGSLADDARVASWFVGIARNLANNAIRRKLRRRDPDTEAAPVKTPLEQVLSAETQALLRQTLEDLPDPHREALILYYFEDRSVSSVAAGLAVSEDVVKQRLHRARQAMRAGLAERFETALERLRPSKGFAALVVAGVAAAARDAAGGPAVATLGNSGAGMSFKSIALVVAGLGCAGTVAAIRHTQAGTASTTSNSLLATDPVGPKVRSLVSRDAAHPEARRLEKAERQQLLHRLRARKVPAAIRTYDFVGEVVTADNAPSDPPVARTGPPDLRYVRDAMRAVSPLVRECYEQRLSSRLELEGTIVVRFTIEGDPDVGGLVGSSEIDPDGTTLDDQKLQECIRETMYAMELDPPTSAAVLKVRYPLAFRPTASEDSDTATAGR